MMRPFPLFYGGNVAYYRALLHAQELVFEQHEHFPKQTFRNRMEILGPNGRQILVIPTVKKKHQRQTVREIAIHYGEAWQKDHWKSLEAAYRRSPYFEYYEHRIQPFFKERRETLFDFNLDLHTVICELMNVTLPCRLTDAFEGYVADDFRLLPWVDENPQSYLQVFSDRHPFTPNLSVLDALFNLGPNAGSLITL